jgi:hypothetical protein
MEITESCLLKFDIAELIIKPPIREGDVADIEMVFLSDNIPASIRGYVTIEAGNKYDARSYPSLSNIMSRSAQKRLRSDMKQLAIQLRGELDDV